MNYSSVLARRTRRPSRHFLLSPLHHGEGRHQCAGNEIRYPGENLGVQVGKVLAVPSQFEGDDFRDWYSCQCSAVKIGSVGLTSGRQDDY